MTRSRQWIGCLAAVAVAVGQVAAFHAPAGAADAKAGKKNQAYVNPKFADFGVRAIGLLPITSINRDLEAEKVVRNALEAGLQPLGYRFLSSTQTLDLARRAGFADALLAMRPALLAGTPPDSATLARAGTVLGLDALLVANLTTYDRYVVDPSVRGQSFTQIGVNVALVSTRDGAVLWRGAFLQKAEGPYNDPSGAYQRDEDAGGLSGHGRSTVGLEPPPYPDVAAALMPKA